MHNQATRRFFTLITLTYLTAVIGLSVVTTTLEQPAGSQVVAGLKESPASTQHSTPKRDTIVSKKPWYIRAEAKRWFHQNIDGYHAEWKCIDEIIYRESRWIPNLYNKQGNGAYGLGQVKNSDHYTKNKPLRQFKAALKYAIARYQTACNALNHHNHHGWY